MSKLDISGEHIRTGTNAPSNNWFAQDARLDRLTDPIFFGASNFAKKHQHPNFGVVLVADQMIHECGARVAIPSDCNSPVHTVGGLRDYVVQLIAHASASGDIGNTAGPVELAVEDV